MTSITRTHHDLVRIEGRVAIWASGVIGGAMGTGAEIIEVADSKRVDMGPLTGGNTRSDQRFTCRSRNSPEPPISSRNVPGDVIDPPRQ